MKFSVLVPSALSSFLGLTAVATSHAQALPTATRSLQPSAFVIVSGVATGVGAGSQAEFSGGKNLSVTAGADLGVYSLGRYVFALEARGTYPVKSGNIVGERSVLGGLRVARGIGDTGRVRPYVDALFGRGQMDYQRGGYLVPGFLYTQTASNLIDGGVGVEVDMTTSVSLKVDGQVQHWNTPVLTDGKAYTKQVGVGFTYRFGAGSGQR